MSLTRKIAEGTAIYTLGTFINNIFGFLTVLLLIKALGKYEYGLLTLALSAFLLTTMFLDLGSLVLIPSEISRFREKSPEIAKSIIKEFAILQVSLGILISFCLIIVSLFIKESYGVLVERLLWIVSTIVISKSVQNIFSVTFYGYMKFKYHQGSDIMNTGMRCLLAFFVLFFEKGVLVALLIYPISIFVTLVFFSPFFWRIWKSMPTGYEKPGIVASIYKKHGKFVVGNVPLKKMYTESPVWIIQFLLGVEAVAVFSVARKVVQFLRGVVTPINNVLFPLLSEISSVDRGKILIIAARGIKYTGFLSIIVFIPTMILLPVFFNLVFKEYMQAVTPARIFLFVILFVPMQSVLTPSLYAVRGQRYIFTSWFYVLPVYLVTFSALTYLFGLTGSVVSWVIGSFMVTLLQYYFLARMLPGIHQIWGNVFKVDYYDQELIKKIYINIRNKIF